MKKITKSAIERLSEEQGSPVLSIYLPTHRLPGPQHSQEDQTRFKNLLREAKSLVEEDDVDSPALNENLSSLEELVDNMVFWQSTLEGLAIFIDEVDVHMYKSPIEFEESVSCGDSFDVTPLHMVNSQNRKFYVLSLALHNPKLYKGDVYGLEEVDVNIPKSLEDALNIDEMFANNKMRRSHRGGPTGVTGTTTPHGEGDTSEAGDAERLQYFKIIEQRITGYPDFDSSRPMLIAATESEASHFKANTSMKNILECAMPGNYTDKSAHEIFEVAWPIIRREVIEKDEIQLVNQFKEYVGVFRASVDIGEITTAAQEGRVETLMVNFIDETNDSVTDYKDGPAPVVRTTLEKHRDRLKELIDLVYSQGGRIVGLDQSKMPDQSLVAASYRY